MGDRIQTGRRTIKNLWRSELIGKNLHAQLFFVADKPSKKNVSQNIPLVGTNSYKTFVNWLADMHIDITRVRIFNQSDRPFSKKQIRLLNEKINTGELKIIALGQKAMTYLNSLDIPEFFVLPHPSGLNRKLNDKQALKETLDSCQSFVYNYKKGE